MTGNPNAETNPKSLRCLFCRGSILFYGLPATKYSKHLYTEHSIIYEAERVIEWTLREQAPHLTGNEERCPETNLPPCPLITSQVTIKTEPLDAQLESDVNLASEMPQNDVTVRDDSYSTEDGDTFESWSRSRCTFKCFCALTMKDSREFMQHINREHKIGYKQYTNRYSQPRISESYLMCKICNESVLHDNKVMELHMKEKHKIELKEYYLKHVKPPAINIAVIPFQASTPQESVPLPKAELNNQTVSQSFDTLSVTKSDPSLHVNDVDLDEDQIMDDLHHKLTVIAAKSLQAGDGIVDENIDTAPFKAEPSRNCPGSPTEDRVDNVHAAVPDSRQDVANDKEGCRPPWCCGMLYECKVCPRQFYEISHLKKHLNASHGTSLEEVTHERGDPTVVSNIYECLICGRGMPHCPSSIRTHLNVHDLTLTLYHEQYKDEIDAEVVDLPITDKELLEKNATRKNPMSIADKSSTHHDTSYKGEWLNRCEYTCKDCDYTTDGYTKLFGHINNTHKSTAKSYLDKHGGKLATKTVKHTCQLCGHILDWDGTWIRKHLSTNHNSISSQEYVEKYEKTYSEFPDLPETEEDRWMNQCSFVCKACEQDQVFTTRNKVLLHLKKEHNLGLAEYKDQHGSIALKLKYMKCKLCYKDVQWDKDCIISHLSKKHNMDHASYASQYMQEVISALKASAKKKAAKSKQVSVTASQQSSTTNLDWLNKCTYACSLCSYQANSYGTFLGHVSMAHQMTGRSYSEQNGGNLCSNRVFHTCQLCGTVLNWERTFISQHVSRLHSHVTLSKYVELFETTYTDTPDLLEKEEHKWMNRSTFYCNECPMRTSYSTRGKLSLHLFREHQIEIKDYMSKHGSNSADVIHHTCKICNKSFRWDADTITTHLEKFHSMTPDQYREAHLSKEDLTSKVSVKKQKLTPRLSESSSNDTLSTMSEWLNRCEYACRFCPFVTHTYNAFFSHVPAHSMSGKEYNETNGGTLCSKIVKHTCQLCGQVLNWDRRLIVTHLTKKHSSTTVEDYYLNHCNTYSDSPDLSDREEDLWMNQCIFECQECTEVKSFNTRSKLTLHLSQEHNIDMKDYADQHRNYISNRVFHTCGICGKSFRWDKDTITAHLEKNHQMSPQEYAKEHVGQNLNALVNSAKKCFSRTAVEPEDLCPTTKWNDKCLYSCKICFDIFPSQRILRWHLHSMHKMSLLVYNERFASDPIRVVTHSCFLCGREMLYDSTAMKVHLKAHHKQMHCEAYRTEYFDMYTVTKTESEWFNRCTYYCKICTTVTLGKEQFKKHISSEHGIVFSSYKEKHGSCVLEEHQHVCQVSGCSKKVLWDKGSLLHHLSKHSLTPDTYYSKYMEKYAKSFERQTEVEKKDWMNKCTFLCKVCFKVYESKQDLRGHTKEDHETSPPDNSEIENAIVKYTLHACQICPESLLWESESLHSHLQKKHSLSLQDYAEKHLTTYKESSDCADKMNEFNSWINKCRFQCKLCDGTSDKIFDRKRQLCNHLSKLHKDTRVGYFTLYEKETFLHYEEHFCQICTKALLWDDTTLQRHFEVTHQIRTEVYRAKYMHRYTTDTAAIEENLKEDNKLVKQSKRASKNRQLDATVSCENEQDEDVVDDNEFGNNEEVRIWARGCLYSCEICDTDHAGVRVFKRHLSGEHKASLASYKRKYGSGQTCVINGFHFCRLCQNNIRHDEDELKQHFRSEHEISVGEYYSKFKAKLKMPRLERPKLTRTTVNQSANDSSTPASARKRTAADSDELDSKRCRSQF